MSINKKNIINIVKILLVLLILAVAIKYENASNKRLIVLLATGALYLLIGVIRNYFVKNNCIYTFLFIADIALIFALEYNSKYVINYFFHSLYILILFEAALTLSRKNSLIIGIVTVIASLIKYFILLYYNSNLSNVSEMAFFTLISMFLLVIISFAQFFKEEKEKKEQLYTELLKAHKRLKEYSEDKKRLMLVKERNRIARDIHDTLGHNMTAFIMELEILSRVVDTDIDGAKKLIENAKSSARDGLVKIREIVETLKPNEENTYDIQPIKQLIDEFSSRTGVEINLEVNGNVVKTTPMINLALYRIIQEALTNAVRHGKASKININIEYIDDRIDFSIDNNGTCDSIHNEGFGIKGMRERIEDVQGEIQFITDGVFTIKGYIPLEVREYDEGYNC